jgi:hypothetical protein
MICICLTFLSDDPQKKMQSLCACSQISGSAFRTNILWYFAVLKDLEDEARPDVIKPYYSEPAL